MSMTIAVVGARERSSIKGPGMGSLSEEDKASIASTDKILVNTILGNLQKKFGSSLEIVSYGCDDGIGLLVKDRCVGIDILIDVPIQFAEIIWYFHGNSRVKAAYAKFYVARNSAIAEIADMFILLINRRRQSMLEDLIQRIDNMEKNGESRPYVCIDEHNKIVKTNMDLSGYLEIDAKGTVIL